MNEDLAAAILSACPLAVKNRIPAIKKQITAIPANTTHNFCKMAFIRPPKSVTCPPLTLLIGLYTANAATGDTKTHSVARDNRII